MGDSKISGTDENVAHAETAALERQLRQDIERGLQFANVLNSINFDQNRETIAIVQTLAELLFRSGVIDVDEFGPTLERMRRRVAERPGPAVRLASKGDKYAAGQTADFDCGPLIPICQARCCRFKFVLTKQDLDEGTARWDYGNPYWIRQGEDGYCVHFDGRTRGCTIHTGRPHTCRWYDCRNDKRIWADFENRILAAGPPPAGPAPAAMMEEVIRRADEDETPATPPPAQGES